VRLPTIRWVDAFLAAQLQPTSTPLAAEITLSQQVRHSSRRFGVALGWIVTGRSGSPILWHNGGTGGSRSFAGFNPERGTAVIPLTRSRRAPSRPPYVFSHTSEHPRHLRLKLYGRQEGDRPEVGV
jgi:CubicO group peptidase (beta-lactamase class C family)